MTSIATQQPIHIIGAGIAGLTLGRCLQNRGIPAILYEKSRKPPSHNYGISLHLPPLLKLLDMDEDSLRSRIAVDAEYGDKGRVQPGSSSLSSAFHAGAFLRANRGKLETLLREGLDIKRQHVCESIDRNGSGHTIFFANQHQVSSKFTVETCGVHSFIHQQLSTASQNTVLPYVVFRGVRKIEGDTTTGNSSRLFNESNVIEVRKGDVMLQVSLNDYQKRSDSASLSYIYSRPARPHDPLHKPDRTTEDANIVMDDFYNELEDFLAQHDLESPFKEALQIKAVKHDRKLHWLMRKSMVTLKELISFAEGGVLMLGDSIHAMPILGGNGANEAIADSVDLAEHIAVLGTKDIKGFYEKKYDIWQRDVKESERRLSEMHSGQKSVL